MRVQISAALSKNTHTTGLVSITAQRTSLRNKVGGVVDRKTNTHVKHVNTSLQEFGPMLPASSATLGSAQSLEEAPSPAALSASQSWPWDPPRDPAKAIFSRSIEAPTELIFSLYKRGDGWCEEIMPHLSMKQRPIEGRKQNIDKVCCHLGWFFCTLSRCFQRAELSCP
jgi:hypothetical protein